MGLKQSIVIRSEYTNNARSAAGKGSRGASPGQYVMRYMAREDATEVLAPTPIVSGDTFFGAYDGEVFMRYMARSEATERLKQKEDDLLQDEDAYGSPLVLKHRFRKMDKLSGRAFGSKGLSLSHEDLTSSSQEIQKAFDGGHSVQKIILSFTEDYLRETGVLNPNFKHKGRGSYKGNIDQLKLREAIIRGVNGMTKTGRFADPEWVGTIQLDTSHVHAHIALVDKEFSDHRMKDDGADRGKINEREKKMFRKGIHFGLEDMKELKSFHQQASLERQSVVSFVKDYAYHTLSENTPVQLLIASLPKNRKAWRFGSNSDAMKHPNKIARNIVEDVFRKQPEESGYDSAIRAVYDYADESMIKNKLTEDERDDLIHEGRERIIERSVNGLYKTLKGIQSSKLRTRTSMTDIQSSSDEELAQALKQSNSNEFDAAAFALRVRGYNDRQTAHTTSARSYYDLSSEYSKAKEEGFVDSSAHVMRLFYEEEQRYHMGLADKYRTFLSFDHPQNRQAVDEMKPKYDELMEIYRIIQSDEEETGVTLLAERDAYKKELRDYTFECFEKGVVSLKEWDAIHLTDGMTGESEVRFVLPVRPKTKAENLNKPHFNTVKAWDVHHLGLDYYNKPDARIDAKNALVFADMWQSRKQKADAARVYVTSTNQSLPVLDAAEKDILEMEPVVEKAVSDGLIETVILDDLPSFDERQKYTISLDQSMNVTKRLKDTLDQAIHQIAIDALDEDQEELE